MQFFSQKSISSFYRGSYRYISIIFLLFVAVGGFFYPLIGLAVPILILMAVVSNFFSRRWFCRSACPNGRALSFGLTSLSRRKPLPKGLSSPGLRRALCGFMLFCVVNMLVRFGGGGAAAARVFWGIYLVSLGISFPMGIHFRPRSWCTICPMGTLQSTIAPGK